MEMDYDQESTYFRGHCIEYDTVDMFQMLVDIALEPRGVMASNVAKAKTQKTHDLKAHLTKYDPFAYNEDLLLRTAYGYKGLGMPHYGLEGNVQKIDARMLQKFVMDNVTPRKCLIVANGVHNHEEFVSLAKERLGELLPVPEHQYERTPSQYIGGEYRNWTETPNTSVTVAFEGVSWQSEHQPELQVMAQLLGSSDDATNLFAQNKNSALVRESPHVEEAHVINSHFSDSGIFGLNVRGAGSHSRELMSSLTEQLNTLKQHISDEDLQRAKNQLKFNLLNEVEGAASRLEEVARNYQTFNGELNFHRYAEKIDQVTAHDINTAAEHLFQGTPTVLVQGSAINLVPNMTDVSKQLN